MLGIGEFIHEIVHRNRKRDVIPPLDGPLSANTRLDAAPVVIDGIEDPNDITIAPSGSAYLCAGRRILRYDGTDFGSPEIVTELPGEVTCVAQHPRGGLVACVAGTGLHFVGGSLDGKVVGSAGGEPLTCLTGVAVTQSGDIFASDGSRRHQPSDWVVDLMDKGRTGRIVHIDAASDEATVLMDARGFPHGVAVSHDQQSIIVTESWKHRLLSLPIAAAASRRIVKASPIPGLDNLPGYPARLCRTGFGYALAVFAMRTQLVDFILNSEDVFRKDMMKRVQRQFWASPQLYAPGHFLDPVQGGGLKKHGSVNAWAPPRSYGLVILLDRNFTMIDSFHSRTGGTCHGVTGVGWFDGTIYAVSKGCQKVVSIPSEVE